MAKKNASKQKLVIKPTFKIENIVASAELGLELDLYTIASKIDDVEYEPEQFPGAILKLKEPKTSLLLFKNGKIICTGGKNEAEVRAAIERTLRMLVGYSKTKPPKGFKPSFTVQNIVASAEMNVELDLYTIASKIDDVEYEPEQFPGAILKFQSPKTSLLLFKNGKVICTGGRSEKEVETALNMAARLLTPYASPLPPSQ
ncbi:MAG: TATA-box-binding protein [Candidatus Micrarchaeota archaeon]|nr:TATA-box-binding protein [Candidatus Micrarchaeota archaeon]